MTTSGNRSGAGSLLAGSGAGWEGIAATPLGICFRDTIFNARKAKERRVVMLRMLMVETLIREESSQL